MAGPTEKSLAIVSTFSPLRDGIAKYAQQQARFFLNQGQAVRKIGLTGSEGDCVLDLLGGTKILQLSPLIQDVELAYIHWHDAFYYYGGPAKQLLTNLAYLWFFLRNRNVVIVCHETYALEQPPTFLHRLVTTLNQAVRRAAWRRVPKIAFHSEQERQRAEKEIGVRFPDASVELVPHGAYFVKESDMAQPEARALLGAAPDRYIFLCIGFIGRHKGFDAPLCAFRDASFPGAALYVVGAVMDDLEDSQNYLGELAELADEQQGSYLINRYISDIEFDQWIIAADCVIVPYKAAFSSSVVERAKLFGKPVILRNVGGLAHQAPNNVFLFEHDSELPARLRDAQRGQQ